MLILIYIKIIYIYICKASLSIFKSAPCIKYLYYNYYYFVVVCIKHCKDIPKFLIFSLRLFSFICRIYRCAATSFGEVTHYYNSNVYLNKVHFIIHSVSEKKLIILPCDYVTPEKCLIVSCFLSIVISIFYSNLNIH